METTTLKSGRILNLQVAPFAVANKLRKVIAGELKGVDVEFEKLDLKADLTALDSKALNTFKNIVCQLMASDAVEGCFFECAARCTLDGQKVTRESFDDPDSRGDFLPTAWEVIKLNIAPFFGSLNLSSLTSGAEKKSGQA